MLLLSSKWDIIIGHILPFGCFLKSFFIICRMTQVPRFLDLSDPKRDLKPILVLSSHATVWGCLVCLRQMDHWGYTNSDIDFRVVVFPGLFFPLDGQIFRRRDVKQQVEVVS